MASIRYPQTVNVVAQGYTDDLEDLFLEAKANGIMKAPSPPPPPPDAKFSEDPVALSVTSYLIWLNNPNRRWCPIEEVGQVTSEARALAHEIRKYYLHRSTMQILKGHQPTEFQQKMIGFLGDTRPLKVDELGILYRLPY